jgi:gas vesicle protein
MANENNDGMAKGLVVGFISGAIVGAVVGLLFAPKAGKELRADIREKAGDLAEEAEEYIQKARAKATELINEGKKRSNDLISDARKKADTLLGDAERILGDARSKNTGDRGRTS